MKTPSQQDILDITDEFNTIVREFAEENITEKQAAELLVSLKKQATELNVPLVIDDPKALLKKISSSKPKAVAAEDFDDYSEEYSEFSEEYSEE